MRIDILTCLPELLASPFAHSIVKRAQDKGLAEIHVHQLRDKAINKHVKLTTSYLVVGPAWCCASSPLPRGWTS